MSVIVCRWETPGVTLPSAVYISIVASLKSQRRVGCDGRLWPTSINPSLHPSFDTETHI